MKKFSRKMLAHLNTANKSNKTDEKENFNKKGVKDLEKVGVIL